MSTTVELPRWNMDVVYSGLASPRFNQDFESLKGDLDALFHEFEKHSIGRVDDEKVDDEVVQVFERIVDYYNSLLEKYITIQAYVSSFVATDSRDEEAQARLSELQLLSVRLTQLDVRFTAWIGSLDASTLSRRSPVAQELNFLLEKARIEAQHLMSMPEEEFAAQLEVTGSSAWSRLHRNVSSQLMVDVEYQGEKPVPMTVVRNMAFDQSRDIRRIGYEAELEAWATVAVPMAAALNSIKGEANIVDARRGWSSPLDAAVFGNNIDRQTLDAMLAAARESFPDFRRYLHAKARLLGVDRLAWYDLFASVGEAGKKWDYEDGVRFIVDQFGTYSPRLSEFASRAFMENWVDAGPRPGKTGGGFCMYLREDESRILVNFTPSYDGVSTLAHELGHAYHNLNLARRPPLLRAHPMTLAETASIFCQTIIERAAIVGASPSEQLAITEAALQDRCQVVVDITSRFLFESAVFKRRTERELSINELTELMLESQRETYGDGLDQSALHPYMWAVKGHYYGPHFYNYPYMFGLLFGLGLYARYQEDADRFKAGYDDFLASTGTADAATLASRFGIDIRDQEFWSSSLDVIRQQVDLFEHLVAETT